MARRRPPPLTKRAKGNKRARTRARIIDAAAEVIGEKGLERASLEEIAARAGLTRGAIYGNFRDKEEIFLAVAASHWSPVRPPDAVPGESLRERMRRYGEAVAAAAVARRPHAVGATSFVQYALTHEHMRRLVATANAQIYAAASARLAEAHPGMAKEAAQFARTVHALTEGLVILHALTPELITREVIVGAFELLASGSESATSRARRRRRRAQASHHS